MFTQADRKSTGSAGRLVAHYFHKSNEGWSPEDPEFNPDHNDRVELLHGEPVDLKLWDKYAAANGKKYGIREYVLAPTEILSEEQAMRMAEIAMEVIDPNQHHDFVLVAHHKKRADGNEAPHYHLLVNEVSFETGKMLDSRERNQRCQMITRLVEYEFGMDPEPRSYDDWVVRRLREMGRDQAANDIAFNLEQAAQFKIIKDIKSDLKPADFSHNEHQRAKRLGVDLAAVRQELRASAGDPAVVARVLVDLEADGFNVVKGRKGNVVLIEKNGWRKSIQRVSGLDDKTDFYSAFAELREIISHEQVEDAAGSDIGRETLGRGVSDDQEATVIGAADVASRGAHQGADAGRGQHRQELGGAGDPAIGADSVRGGSSRRGNQEGRPGAGVPGADQHRDGREVSDTAGRATGGASLTGLGKLRRASAAAGVSSRTDALLNKISDARAPKRTGLTILRRAAAAAGVEGRLDTIISRIEKAVAPPKPTGLQKLRRGAVAEQVSGRLDRLMGRIERDRRPTGLQKLRRGAAAGVVAGRMNAIMAQIDQPNGSAPVAMYVNDNDPNAWQIRMQQWSDSMRRAQQGPGMP